MGEDQRVRPMELGHFPVANSSRITRCDLVSHQLVRVWRWVEDCGLLKNIALVGQPSGSSCSLGSSCRAVSAKRWFESRTPWGIGN